MIPVGFEPAVREVGRQRRRVERLTIRLERADQQAAVEMAGVEGRVEVA